MPITFAPGYNADAGAQFQQLSSSLLEYFLRGEQLKQQKESMRINKMRAQTEEATRVGQFNTANDGFNNLVGSLLQPNLAGDGMPPPGTIIGPYKPVPTSSRPLQDRGHGMETPEQPVSVPQIQPMREETEQTPNTAFGQAILADPLIGPALRNAYATLRTSKNPEEVLAAQAQISQLWGQATDRREGLEGPVAREQSRMAAAGRREAEDMADAEVIAFLGDNAEAVNAYRAARAVTRANFGSPQATVEAIGIVAPSARERVDMASTVQQMRHFAEREEADRFASGFLARVYGLPDDMYFPDAARLVADLQKDIMVTDRRAAHSLHETRVRGEYGVRQAMIGAAERNNAEGIKARGFLAQAVLQEVGKRMSTGGVDVQTAMAQIGEVVATLGISPELTQRMLPTLQQATADIATYTPILHGRQHSGPAEAKRFFGEMRRQLISSGRTPEQADAVVHHFESRTAPRSALPVAKQGGVAAHTEATNNLRELVPAYDPTRGAAATPNSSQLQFQGDSLGAPIPGGAIPTPQPRVEIGATPTHQPLLRNADGAIVPRPNVQFLQSKLAEAEAMYARYPNASTAAEVTRWKSLLQNP